MFRSFRIPPPDLSKFDVQIRAQTTNYSQARGALAATESQYSKMKRDNAIRYRYKRKPYSETDLANIRALIKKKQNLVGAASSILKRYQRQRQDAMAIRVVNAKNLADNSIIQLHARSGMLATAKIMTVGQQYIVEGRRMSSGVIIMTKAAAAAN